MKVLVVCQYYDPEEFQVNDICRQLVHDGYDVTVLTGLPNYPSGVVPKEYRKGHRKEVLDGVKVVRCYERGRGRGAAALALNYASFALSAMQKVRRLSRGYDLVLCYQLSPVFMALPAVWAARRCHAPLLVYVCDLWPESMKLYVGSERNPAFLAAKYISRKVYRAADRLAVQSPSFASYLCKVHGIRRGRVAYIPAFADGGYLGQDFRKEGGTVDFVFLGNLGIAQDLYCVLDAVKGIRGIPGFRVHFVGDGACLDGMRRYVERNGLGAIVRFYGRRPQGEMPKYYRLADACLVSLRAGSAVGLTMPVKVQGYMAAGKPVIAMAHGSTKEVVEASGCGVCVEPSNAKALAAAMEDFIRHREKYAGCGERGRAYFRAHFTKQIFMEALEREIEQLGGRKE